MAINVITEDRASGAQVIDGSLKFDGGYLTRTPGSVGNRRTFTWSAWIKRSDLASRTAVWGAGTTNGSGNPGGSMYFDSSSGTFRVVNGGGTVFSRVTSANLRDTGWYHIVVAIDTTQSTDSDRVTIYINGEKATVSGTLASEDFQLDYNNTIIHAIGTRTDDGSLPASIFNGHMSQVYLIDGLALGPGYFGFTDPLTNTWRPKKFRAEGTTVNDGTVWSSGIPGNVLSGYPATQGFDGNTSNYVYADNASTMTWTAPKRITGQKIEVYVYAGGNWPILRVNGKSTGAVVSGNTQHNVWVDVTDLCGGPGGRLETITAFGQNIGGVDRSSGWSAVRVDGVTLIDSTTTNLAFGTNGFYLPFDGNSPIGEDKSGNGNNWTPVNFGGSNSIEKATGALPILNTVNGGRVATAGIRTDATVAAGVGTCVLALPLIGNDDDVSNRVNSTSTTKTVTANGNAAASSDQSNFYGGSFEFDGTGDYLSVSDNDDFHYGSDDFTAECWVYPTASPNQPMLMGQWDGAGGGTGLSWAMQLSNNSSRYLRALISSDGSGVVFDMVSSVSLGLNKWNHCAFVRSGNTFTLYLNGHNVTSTTNSSSLYNATNALTIGATSGNTQPFQGYLQDVRVYKGTAKYTSNFIPAATSPDILPDTPSGVSGSFKLTKITDGAVSFDGSNDSIEFTDNGDMNPGSGDFTVEGFVNTNNISGERHYPIIQKGNTASNNNYDWRVYFNDTANSNTHLWFDADCGGDSVGMGANGDDELTIGNWYHFAVTRSSGTFRMFLNGVLQDTDSSTTNAIDNDYTGVEIGFNDLGGAGDTYLDGFISNLRFIKGTALYTANFTPPTEPLTAVTNTKLLCCQSTTSATAAAVTPASITNNGSTQATTFSPFNTDINTVRGQESGYCTLNPLSYQTTGTYGTSVPILSDGNLTFTHGQTGQWERSNASFGVGEGKWYFEFKIITRPELVGSSTENWAVGVRESDSSSFYGETDGFEDSGDHVYWIDAGTAKIVSDQDRSAGSTSGITAVVNGDTINIAFEKTATALKVWFGKNGIYFNSGNPATGSNPAVNHSTTTEFIIPSIAFYQYSGQNEPKGSVNFGQKPFKFPSPDGFQPLSASTARPETVISNPEIYFKPLIYDAAGGQGGSRHIDVGFEADFIWIKNRNSVKWHILVNGVIGYDKFMSSNSDMALSTEAHVTNVHKTGYTVNDIDSGTVNEPGLTYVAWNWKAGGHSSNYNIDGAGYATASAAGLSCTADLQGASIGTKQGFSIIQYQATSGETVAHGLSQQPDFMMIKNYDTQNDWMIYHKNGNGSGGDMSSSQGLNLNNDDGTFTSGSNTFITGKSATTFTVGSSAIVQNGSDDYCAFVWHNVPGLQKFGYYQGNNSSDGAYVELGFKPALLIIKRTDADGYYWTLFDSARRTFNVNNHTLNPESNRAEETSGGNGEVDFLSSGFKCRDTDGGINGDGGDYIYMAWAEAPSFNLYGAQSNAR